MDSTPERWEFIRHNMQLQSPVMLLYVVESIGSSPGRQGFSMAVNAAGEVRGSVGGGIMEHKFVEMAKEKLIREKKLIALHRQVHNKEAAKNQSGMICSGEQTILLYILQPGDATHVDKIITSLQQHTAGCLSLSPAGISYRNNIPPSKYLFSMVSANEWLYEEQTGYKDHLYIIGAGHCGLALSKLMQAMDFYIHLYEERGDLNTLHENSFVHERKLLADFSEAGNYIPDGNNTYVVLMTSGYRTDDLVLRSLFHRHFKYLGVLGSAKKIEKMFAEYRATGIAENILAGIHAPIGLPIKSRTPEEIAVSIAAQVILVKNG